MIPYTKPTLGICLVLVALGSLGRPLGAAVSIPRRVACVGDSITAGAGLPDPTHQAYPADLGATLGSGTTVGNFGHSGATLLSHGDLPYTSTAECTAALKFAPDTVLIMLGTNDSKSQNWAHGSDFSGDLTTLVKRFQALPSHPRVWLCLPPPAYSGGYGITEAVIRDQIIPRIKAVAKSLHLPVIDIYGAMSGHASDFGDGIHPTVQGDARLAHAVAKALLSPAAAPRHQP